MMGGNGRPSRSTQPVVSDQRATVPRVTRSLDSPEGNPPSDGGTVTFADMVFLLCCGVTDTHAGLRPGGRPRRGEEDRLERAERWFVRDGVVDRFEVVLVA